MPNIWSGRPGPPEDARSRAGSAADHATSDSMATATERGRVIRMIVATGMDHQ